MEVEDVIMGVLKYVLYAFGGYLGLVVSYLIIWMMVRCCSLYVFKSACRTVNSVEGEIWLLKLINSLHHRLTEDNVNALL